MLKGEKDQILSEKKKAKRLSRRVQGFSRKCYRFPKSIFYYYSLLPVPVGHLKMVTLESVGPYEKKSKNKWQNFSLCIEAWVIIIIKLGDDMLFSEVSDFMSKKKGGWEEKNSIKWVPWCFYVTWHINMLLILLFKLVHCTQCSEKKMKIVHFPMGFL